MTKNNITIPLSLSDFAEGVTIQRGNIERGYVPRGKRKPVPFTKEIAGEELHLLRGIAEDRATDYAILLGRIAELESALLGDELPGDAEPELPICNVCGWKVLGGPFADESQTCDHCLEKIACGELGVVSA